MKGQVRHRGRAGGHARGCWTVAPRGKRQGAHRVFIECTTILICCCLSSSGESYTIFRPNTGMVNLYTGPWSSSLSVARMKERCASGP